MKKILILFALAIIVTSCGKTPINGKLDGMWQLMKIEKENGEDINTKKERIYYSIQLHLINLTKVNAPQYLGRFNHAGDSLFVHDFRVEGDNSTLATKEQLETFGLSEVSERFGVEKLDRKDMVLKSKTARLIFRKF